MSSETLQSKTCKELREIAKGLKVLGRWDMTKEELITNIMAASENGKSDVDEASNQSATDEHKDDVPACEEEVKCENEMADAEFNMKRKMRYIESAEIGVIVAFRLPNGRVKSAKVVKKSTKNRKLKLETSYNAEYIVSYDDVIWVRTGKRWPKGVYELLKGKVDNGKERTAI